MVRAKLRLMCSRSGGIQKQPLPFVLRTLTSQEVHDKYVRCLEQKLVDWSSSTEFSAEECRNQLRSGITSSAEESIYR